MSDRRGASSSRSPQRTSKRAEPSRGVVAEGEVGAVDAARGATAPGTGPTRIASVALAEDAVLERRRRGAHAAEGGERERGGADGGAMPAEGITRACARTGRQTMPNGSVRLYNTMTQRLEPLEPLEPGHVQVYVCGLTTYDHAHAGHARTFIAFDVLVRLPARPRATG